MSPIHFIYLYHYNTQVWIIYAGFYRTLYIRWIFVWVDWPDHVRFCSVILIIYGLNEIERKLEELWLDWDLNSHNHTQSTWIERQTNKLSHAVEVWSTYEIRRSHGLTRRPHHASIGIGIGILTVEAWSSSTPPPPPPQSPLTANCHCHAVLVHHQSRDSRREKTKQRIPRLWMCMTACAARDCRFVVDRGTRALVCRGSGILGTWEIYWFFLGRRNPIQLKKKVAAILVLQRQRLPTSSDSDQALSIADLDLQLWSVEEEEQQQEDWRKRLLATPVRPAVTPSQKFNAVGTPQRWKLPALTHYCSLEIHIYEEQWIMLGPSALQLSLPRLTTQQRSTAVPCTWFPSDSPRSN